MLTIALLVLILSSLSFLGGMKNIPPSTDNSGTVTIQTACDQNNYFSMCDPSRIKIFGQKNSKLTSRDTVSANKIYHASGIVIDTSVKPNRIYTPDTGNNRILGFSSLGYCSINTSTKCTNDSDCPNQQCIIDGSKNADIVFGQDNFSDSACNRDNNIGIFNKPTNKSLCFIDFPIATNISEIWTRLNLDVDKEGNLYVPDIHNNRILIYYQPFSTDKSNGKGDSIADFVIGQNDFKSNSENIGLGKFNRNEKSIYIGIGYPSPTSKGVSVDSQGNVWVADTHNGRVLRFPKGLNTADLVIGQANFTSSERFCTIDDSSNLHRLCAPSLAKINPDTGELFVLDELDLPQKPFAARILVFTPPFTNGMSASKNIKAKQDKPLSNTDWTYFFQSSGFTFNKYKTGDYANGIIWVSEHISNRVSLLDANGNILKVIGAKDKYQRGCDYAYYGTCKGPDAIFNNFNLCWPGGSPALDDNNNIYLADENFHRISRFNLPYTLTKHSTSNLMCIPDPNGGMFNGTTPNKVGPGNTSESVGLLAYNNQLILKDFDRYLIWNNYKTNNNSNNADFIIGQKDSITRESNQYQLGSRSFHTVDDKARMWTNNGHGKLIVYQLPLIKTSEPIANFVKLFWSDNPSSEVSYSATSITFHPLEKALYLTDIENHRILRISNYENISNGNKLLVDKVIGQPDKNTTKCNHYYPNNWTADSPPTAESLCGPLQVEVDKLGNLFVTENNYECHGNNRILVYTYEDLKANNKLFPKLNAKKVFISNSFTESVGPGMDRDCKTDQSYISMTFNSKNNLVVGNDGYFNDNNIRYLHQLYIFDDPLKKNPDGSFVQGQKPDRVYFYLPMGAPGEIQFDEADNLIVQDHTWSRTWLIINQVTSTPTPNQTPTVTIEPSLSVSPSPYPLPSLSLSPTPRAHSGGGGGGGSNKPSATPAIKERGFENISSTVKTCVNNYSKSSNRLIDIKDDAFEGYIISLNCRDSIKGYPDKTYRSDEQITRGQMAKYIVNSFKIPINKAGETFIDIKNEEIFYDYIITLKNTNIASGYSDGTYRPGDFVKRQEVSKFIVEAIKVKGVNIYYKDASYTDLDAYNKFRGYIGFLSSENINNEKIIQGFSDGSYRPNDYVTRGQMAKIIENSVRYLEKFNAL